LCSARAPERVQGAVLLPESLSFAITIEEVVGRR
jgi:hypothetical protein